MSLLRGRRLWSSRSGYISPHHRADENHSRASRLMIRGKRGQRARFRSPINPDAPKASSGSRWHTNPSPQPERAILRYLLQPVGAVSCNKRFLVLQKGFVEKKGPQPLFPPPGKTKLRPKLGPQGGQSSALVFFSYGIVPTLGIC